MRADSDFLSQAKLLVVLMIGYTIFYFFNNYLTQFLYLLPGAHLIHLPSGIKILMVLITGWVGGLAIFIAGLLWGLLIAFPGQYALVLLLSAMGALVPSLVCQFFTRRFALNEDLSNLSWQIMLGIAISFAFFNSLAIQSILDLSDPKHELANGFVVMFLGDLTGIMLVYLLARWLGPSILRKLTKIN